MLHSNESISGASNKSLDTYLPIGEIGFETVFEIRVRRRRRPTTSLSRLCKRSDSTTCFSLVALSVHADIVREREKGRKKGKENERERGS